MGYGGCLIYEITQLISFNFCIGSTSKAEGEFKFCSYWSNIRVTRTSVRMKCIESLKNDIKYRYHEAETSSFRTPFDMNI